MAGKYRKKPVVIEAIKWDGMNLDECKRFCGKALKLDYPTLDDSVVLLSIDTLEGEMHVNLGSYIIKGVEGEFYPCKADIFEQTYEEVV